MGIRIHIAFTTDKEKNAVNNLVDKYYQDRVTSVTKFADEIIVDGNEKVMAKLRSDLQHYIIQYPGIHINIEGELKIKGPKIKKDKSQR